MSLLFDAAVRRLWETFPLISACRCVCSTITLMAGQAIPDEGTWRKEVFHSIPGRGRYTVTYSPGCQARTSFFFSQTGLIWLTWPWVGIRMSRNCGFVVTSSSGCCFALLSFCGREVLYHEWSQWHDDWKESKGDAVCIEGMPEGMLAVMTHSFSAILLSCSGPYQKFMQNKADPVKCKWTAGGTQLWLHAGWEVYMVCKL